MSALTTSPLEKVNAFCEQYELSIPILMAPMAGACPASLAIAVGNAGGMGACGTLLMEPDKIVEWVNEVRGSTNGAFQLNTWIPDPDPVRNESHEHAVREFLGQWGPPVDTNAIDVAQVSFSDQCDAMINASPRVISSIMGLYPPDVVARFKTENIAWFTTVTTVSEALEAERAGADAIVAQGMEAGGHRGAFNADDASSNLVGLFSLLPSIVDAVNIPVIATGGVANARQIAAAITLGASAVQIGTGLLRSPEAKLNKAWSDAIAQAKPEDTTTTRAFSGRLGRAIRSDYTQASAREDTPIPAPYPLQRNLTSAMRNAAAEQKDISRMQAWAGQSSAYASDKPAGETIENLWQQAQQYLR